MLFYLRNAKIDLELFLEVGTIPKQNMSKIVYLNCVLSQTADN